MSKILDAMANGKLICQTEQLGQNAELDEADGVFFQLAEQLKEWVNDPEKQLLNSLLDAELDVRIACGEDRFSYGFRIGALLMMEVFSSRNPIIKTVSDI